MSSVLTNRLVGSAILIIAAVVFLPDLLDGQKEIRKDDFKAIPERPEFAKVTEPADINAAQHQAAQQAAQQLPTDPEPQQLDGSGMTPTGQPAEPTTADMAGGQAAVSDASVGSAQQAGVPPTAGQQAGGNASQSASAPGNPAPNNAVSNNAVSGNAVSGNPAPGKTATVQTGTMEKPLSVESGHSDALAAEAAAEQSAGEQSAVAGKPAAQDKPVAATAEPATERVATPAVPAGQAAFVVKVGSFGKSQNAEQLVGKLKAAGFPAFTRKIRTAQGTEMVSVMVGPELKKARLEAQLPQLQALVQIPGLKVIGYQVVENN